MVGWSRQGDRNSPTVTLQLEDTKVDALRRRAQRLGLEPQQLLAATIEGLIGQPARLKVYAATRSTTIPGARISKKTTRPRKEWLLSTSHFAFWDANARIGE